MVANTCGDARSQVALRSELASVEHVRNVGHQRSEEQPRRRIAAGEPRRAGSSPRLARGVHRPSGISKQMFGRPSRALMEDVGLSAGVYARVIRPYGRVIAGLVVRDLLHGFRAPDRTSPGRVHVRAASVRWVGGGAHARARPPRRAPSLPRRVLSIMAARLKPQLRACINASKATRAAAGFDVNVDFTKEAMIAAWATDAVLVVGVFSCSRRVLSVSSASTQNEANLITRRSTRTTVTTPPSVSWMQRLFKSVTAMPAEASDQPSTAPAGGLREHKR